MFPIKTEFQDNEHVGKCRILDGRKTASGLSRKTEDDTIYTEKKGLDLGRAYRDLARGRSA